MERALRENPNNDEARVLLATLKSPSAAQPPVTTTATPAGGSLTPESRAKIVDRLKQVAPGAPVWFALDERDPDSRTLATSLRDAFLDGGWVVRAFRSVPFRLKPGVSLFIGDEQPPPYVRAAQEGLERGGLAPMIGTGYRAFYEERRRANPNYIGIPLDRDQAFIIVVGPRPRRP